MEILMDDIDELHGKILMHTECEKTLERIKEKFPEYLENERVYQNYRKKFSEAYFSGSPWNYGECWTDWFLERPFQKKEIGLMFVFCWCINGLNKNTLY